MCSSRTPARPDDQLADAIAGGPLAPSELVARIAVQPVDEQLWIYADIGLFKLMALLAREQHAGAATTWLASELQRLGVTVERENIAQD